VSRIGHGYLLGVT